MGIKEGEGMAIKSKWTKVSVRIYAPVAKKLGAYEMNVFLGTLQKKNIQDSLTLSFWCILAGCPSYFGP